MPNSDVEEFGCQTNIHFIIIINIVWYSPIDIGVLPFLNLTDNANVFTGVDDVATEFKFSVPFYFNGKTYVNGFVSYHKILDTFLCTDL